jgi:hypothetical protein
MPKARRILFVVTGFTAFVGMGVGLMLLLLRGDAAPEQQLPLPEPIVLVKTPLVTAHQKKVKEAVTRGVAFLKKRLLDGNVSVSDGRFGKQALVGANALAGVAMLEGGAGADDAGVQKALALVRAEGPNITVIYALGSILFFLNRLNDDGALTDPDKELLRTLALRMVAGQLTDGRWSYVNPPISGEAETYLLIRLENNTYKPSRPGTGSNSMTQFAILSLWGARKHGIPVRPALLAAAVSFHGTQKRNGTWSYHLQDILHDSNTCAGLLALAMEKTLREDKEFRTASAFDPPANSKVDPQRDRAFAHLANVIGRTKESPAPYQDQYTGNIIRADAWGDYYFLWCLERVSVIYGLQHIGGKDWYDWGSDVILKTQRADGGWLDRHGDVPDTAFAILFLTKANLAKDLTDKLRELMGQGDIQGVPGNSDPASPKKD